MSSPAEPRNPLYLLLLVVGLVFVVTALALALVPVIEQKATDAGNPPPPSAFRDALRADGWKWLLYEVAVLIVVGLASMVWDRLRGLQNAPPGSTIAEDTRHPPPATVPHEQGEDDRGPGQASAEGR